MTAKDAAVDITKIDNVPLRMMVADTLDAWAMSQSIDWTGGEGTS